MKTRLMSGCIALMSVVLVLSGQTRGTQSPDSATASISSKQALLNQYCVTCHNEKQKSAGLALDKLDLARIGDNAEVWEKVVHKVRSGMQPPSGKPRPDAT